MPSSSNLHYKSRLPHTAADLLNMSMDTNEALLDALQDNISKLQKVNVSKNELLTKKDSQLAALRKSGNQKLEHILYLESERTLPDPEDLDPTCDYHQLYKPARRTQIQQYHQELIDPDLAAAMASLTVVKDEVQLAEAQKHSCGREVEQLVLWKGKVEQNLEVLEEKQEQLTETVDNLQDMVRQLNTTVAELKKQKADLTVEIQNMNVHIHHETYNFNAPLSSTSISGHLGLSDRVAEVPASTSSISRPPWSLSALTSTTNIPQERFPPLSTTSIAEKALILAPITPSGSQKKRTPPQSSKAHAR